MSRMREKENYRSDPSYPTKNRKFWKKITKKYKKLKCTIQASFQAKTGQDKSRKKEKNIIAPILSTRPWIENSIKRAKKIKNTIQA